MSDSPEPSLQQLFEKMHDAISRDEQIKRRFFQNLQTEYNQSRKDSHVTNLTLCLRQAAYRKLEPKPISTKQLSYFLEGARRHETLEGLYRSGDPVHIVTEKKGVDRCVAYSFNIYHNIPEFKTSRSIERTIQEHWIKQLAYYMLAVNSDVGIIQIQKIHPNDAGLDASLSYLIEFTSEIQKSYWLLDFLDRRRIFRLAVKLKDPSWAPIYRGEGNWVCNNYNYRTQCDALESTIAKAKKNDEGVLLSSSGEK